MDVSRCFDRPGARLRAGLLCALAGTLVAAGPPNADPPWQVPASPTRWVVLDAPPEGEQFLVQLPVAPTGMVVCLADRHGVWATNTMLLPIAGEAAAVVARPGRPLRAPCMVYLCPAESIPAGDHSPAAATAAIGLELYKLPGKGAADSIEKVRYLLAAAGKPGLRCVTNRLGALRVDQLVEHTAAGDERERKELLRAFSSERKGNEPPNVLGRHVTHVLFDGDGSWRPAARGSVPFVMLFDGEPVVEHLGLYPSGAWEWGAELDVARGVHTVELLWYADRDVELDAAFGRPGEDEPVGLFSGLPLLASVRCRDLRREDATAEMHPAIRAEWGRPYRFAGGPGLVPVTLRDESVHWRGLSYARQWTVAGHALTEEGPMVRRMVAMDRPLRVVLSLQDSDRVGAMLETDLLPPAHAVASECRLSTTLRAAPTALYQGERLEPHLLLEGEWPEALDLEVAMVAESGPTRSDRLIEHLRMKAGDMPDLAGPGLAAEPDAAFRWSVSHAGTVLAGGHLTFAPPPFPPVQAGLPGEGWRTADDGRVTLLPRLYKDRVHGPPVLRPGTSGRVLVLDEALTVPSAAWRSRPTRELLEAAVCAGAGLRFEPGAFVYDGRVADAATLDGWCERILRRGDDPLALVVVCAGPGALRDGVDPGVFERRFAALLDAVLLGPGVPVVVMTPPPDGTRPYAIRPYVLAAKRAAYVRSLPVADVYTVWMAQGRGRPAGLFSAESGAPGRDAIRRAMGELERAVRETRATEPAGGVR